MVDPNLIVIIAAIYSTITVLSLRKFGFFQALLWPALIIGIGIIAFFSYLFQPPPEE